MGSPEPASRDAANATHPPPDLERDTIGVLGGGSEYAYFYLARSVLVVASLVITIALTKRAASKRCILFTAGTLTRGQGVIAFTTTAALISFWSRTVLSVVILNIAEQYALEPSACAKALSCFFHGYLCSNAAAAVLLRRCHAGTLLMVCMFGSSCIALATPTALAQLGVQGLIMCRVLHGLLQGLLFPSFYGIFSQEFANDETARTRATAALGGMAPLGIAANFLISPILVKRAGWQITIVIAGWLGIPWCILWFLSPCRHKQPPKDSCPEDSTDKQSASLLSVLGQILRARPFYAIAAGHFSHNWTSFALMAWLPTYLRDALEVRGDSMAVSCLPYLGMAVASPMGGAITNKLLSKGDRDLWQVRRLMGAIGLLGPAFCIALFPLVSAVLWPLPLIIITLALIVSTLVPSSVLAGPLDIAGPRVSGTLFAVTNAFSSIAGFASVEVIGALRTCCGWTSAFGFCAVIYCVATAVWVKLGAARRIFD